jgi:hypothetical protein
MTAITTPMLGPVQFSDSCYSNSIMCRPDPYWKKREKVTYQQLEEQCQSGRNLEAFDMGKRNSQVCSCNIQGTVVEC